MLRISTRVVESGALFDARGHRIFSEYAEDLEDEGAEWALSHIRATFHTSFKVPTGYYESHVHIHNTMGGLEVWDGGEAGPVYGPWLEGVGSRNAATRFKGYHAFRKAATALEARIEAMGERLLHRNVIHRL
jgi:hypothetical protein